MNENPTWFNPLPPPGASGPWFRKELQRLGVQLAPDSSLAKGLTALAEEQVANGVRLLTTIDQVVEDRLRIFGTDYLTKAVHQAHSHGWLEWEQKARMLKKGDPNPFFPAEQTMARDHSWELLVGAVCSTFCTNVVFAEPDVVATFSGERIGIAAKMHYRGGFSRLEKSIIKGAKQVQQQFDDDAVDCGVVLANLASAWPHRRILSSLRGAHQFDPDEIRRTIGEQAASFVAQRNLETWRVRLGERTAVDCILACIPTLVPVAADFVVPFFYSEILGERDDPRTKFVAAFHTAAQQILKWQG